jgi:acetylglutamate kinase
MGERLVLKIGGNDLDDPAFVDGLTGTLVALAADGAVPPVIVHGGGKEIANLQRTLGLEPRFVDGLRVTDADSLSVATMVLCGAVNKRLVTALMLAGLDTLGLSGMDRGIIRVKKMAHPKGDLGRVGIPVSVRGEVLEALLTERVIPVLAPISLGLDGAYNVNADQVAGAVASELGATLLFLTNVPGVLVKDRLVETLSAAQAQAWIESGVIQGGMLPKVRSALGALESGAPAARILNLNGLQNSGGTTLVA